MSTPTSDQRHGALARTRRATWRRVAGYVVVAAAALGLAWGGATTAADTTGEMALAAPTLTSPSSPSSDPYPEWRFAGVAGATFECWFKQPNGQFEKYACTSPQRYGLTLVEDGTYSFGVRQHDPLGNTSAWASSSYLLDRQASGTPTPVPTPGMPTLVTSPDTYSRDATPTWTFTGEPAARFSCTLSAPFEGVWDGGSDGQQPEPDPVIVDSGACDSGAYTFDLGVYPDHGYTLSVTQTDAAGKSSPALVDWYILDRIAYAPIIRTAPDDPSNDPTLTWTLYVYDASSARLTCTLVRNESATPRRVPELTIRLSA